MAAIINSSTAKLAAMEVRDYYMKSDEVVKSILHHSGIQGAIALIPIPIVGETACIVNQLHMYHKINKLLGVKFSKNVMKVMGTFLLSQVSGAAAMVAGLALLKFIPGINFASGFVEAPFVAAINYTCGMVYYGMLQRYLSSGVLQANASDEEIINGLKSNSMSKDEIRGIYGDAKKTVKGLNYDSYKTEAESCVDEAKEQNG